MSQNRWAIALMFGGAAIGLIGSALGVNASIALGVLCAVAGFVVLLWPRKKEIEPIRIDVRLKELYRVPNDRYSDFAFDLFLRIRLELQQATQAEPLKFRFELLLNGLVEAHENINLGSVGTWNVGAPERWRRVNFLSSRSIAHFAQTP